MFFGGGFGGSFCNRFFHLHGSSFLLSGYLPLLLFSLMATSSEGFILTGVTGVLLVGEEDDDGSGAPRRGQ